MLSNFSVSTWFWSCKRVDCVLLAGEDDCCLASLTTCGCKLGSLRDLKVIGVEQMIVVYKLIKSALDYCSSKTRKTSPKK